MKILDPFNAFNVRVKKTSFYICLFLTLLLMITLRVLGQPLINETAPIGIITFELSGNLEQSLSIIESWGESGRLYAGIGLGVDYLFLVVYSLCLALGCVLLSDMTKHKSIIISQIGLIISWTALLAGLLDAVENFALLQLLLGAKQAYWPIIAQYFAIPKFLFVIASLIYLIAASLFNKYNKGTL